MIPLSKSSYKGQEQPREKDLLISRNNDMLIHMKRKGIIFCTIVLVGLFTPIMHVISKTESFSPVINQLSLETTGPLDNVSIEMITDLPSYRSDNIPSTLPGDSFGVCFNVTNNSDQNLNLLEFYTQTNDFGTIQNPSDSTKDYLEIGESWITNEHSILTEPTAGVSSALDLVIVLDQSGSMGDEIETLTSELIRVIDEIDLEVPDLRVGLVLFGGNPDYNPYLEESLIFPLTFDVVDIVNVLDQTAANGGTEPWGDALYATKVNLDWRTDAVKLVVLITDEENNGGTVIKSASQLNDIYQQYAVEGFILCTIAATGSNTQVFDQLRSGAEITGGTYIEIGSEYPQTIDIPDIIGELIVLYAVELDFRITVQLSHMNDQDERSSIEKTFVVLLDDLPPEIDTWVYFSEDFLTDERQVNIMSEIKDVTGVSFVEIYYKFDRAMFWTIANATSLFNDSYCLSLLFTDQTEFLSYQIYTEDWLGNEIYCEIQEIDLADIYKYSTIPFDKKKEIILQPNQRVVYRLTSHPITDSYGIIIGDDYDTYDIFAIDTTDSSIRLDKLDSNYDTFVIPADHTIKISLVSSEIVKVLIANAIPQRLELGDTTSVTIGTEDAYLFEIDNRIESTEYRKFYADSYVVQTGIYVFNASNMDYLYKRSSEVYLTEDEFLLLVVADYHVGEIDIGFVDEYEYDTHDHYYAKSSSWPIFVTILGLTALLGFLKRKKR